MARYQTYAIKGSDKQIRVAIKGPVFVRFGVVKISTFPPKREGSKC